MKTIRLTVDLTYDEQIMHSDDPEDYAYFVENVLKNSKTGEQLILHSNYIGDEVGEIKVIEITESVNG
jgi:hypothetical protein